MSPRKTFNLGLGFLAGLALGVGSTVVRQFLDTTVRSPQALRAISEAPVLAVIPYDRAAKKAPLIVDRKNQSLRAEAFRQLRTNLQFTDVERPVRVLVVTSSVANEGKSSTATNLAIAFADSGRRVLLIEADLRRPRVADYLGLEGSVGLTNVLVGQAKIDDVVQPWGKAGLDVLPSGSIPPNPSELLGSTAMVELLELLKGRYNMIVLDTPPLLPVTDGAVAAAMADAAVLVVRHGKTTRNQINTAQRSLKAVDARLLGMILNLSPVRGVDAYESHSYGYYEDDERKRPKSDASEEIEVEARSAASDAEGEADQTGPRKLSASPSDVDSAPEVTSEVIVHRPSPRLLALNGRSLEVAEIAGGESPAAAPRPGNAAAESAVLRRSRRLSRYDTTRVQHRIAVAARGRKRAPRA